MAFLENFRIEEPILLIEKAGLKLQLPITTIARSMILYHHFKRCVAEVNYEDSIIAATAITLSCQVDQRNITNQQIIIVFLNMKNATQITINSAEFQKFKSNLGQAKEFFNRMLKFNLKHELAYQYLVFFLRALHKKEMFQQFWDRFVKTVFKVVASIYMSKHCLDYEASVIAVIAIHVACDFCGINVRALGEWHQALSIPFDDRLRAAICDTIAVCNYSAIILEKAKVTQE